MFNKLDPFYLKKMFKSKTPVELFKAGTDYLNFKFNELLFIIFKK